MKSDWRFSEEGRKYLANRQWLKLYHYPRQNGRLVLVLFFYLQTYVKKSDSVVSETTTSVLNFCYFTYVFLCIFRTAVPIIHN